MVLIGFRSGVSPKGPRIEGLVPSLVLIGVVTLLGAGSTWRIFGDWGCAYKRVLEPGIILCFCLHYHVLSRSVPRSFTIQVRPCNTATVMDRNFKLSRCGFGLMLASRYLGSQIR